jgi:hypothetical protein
MVNGRWGCKFFYECASSQANDCESYYTCSNLKNSTSQRQRKE